MRLRSSALAFLTLASASLPAAWAQSCQVRPATLQGSYVGDCIVGMASGKGRAVGTDRYEGSFRDGWPTGYGVYTFADGRRFEGEFLDGKVHGRARFSYTNGDVLEGVFKDNALTGTGRMQRASGESLLVQVQNGAMVVLGSAPAAAPVAPAQAAAPAAAPQAVPSGAPAQAGGTGTGTAAQWAPRLDLEDLFPSYILATATRKPPQPSPNSRSVNRARGDDLGRSLIPVPPPDATSRVASLTDKATYVGDNWGLVGVRVRTTEPNSEVTVRVVVDEVAEPSEETFRLQAPGEYALYPKLRYKYDKLRQVAQPTPVNVTWSLSINGRSQGTRTQTTRLRATQDAPWAAAGERGDEYMGWVFAAFVTEDAPWIDDFLQQAFAGMKTGPFGYQGSEEDAIAQVATVYEHLRKRGVKYSSITRTSGASNRVFSQAVRFPSDAIRTSQANCVDGTVLMASILRKIDIEPFIVLGPGHAMLGFLSKRLGKDDDWRKHFYVVETTMIGTAGFVDAVKRGMSNFAKWEKENAKDPDFDVISVGAARRAGVMPIAR